MGLRQDIYRIFIKKAPCDWASIEAHMKDGNRRHINAYINRKVSQLVKQYEECPTCISEKFEPKQQRAYYLSPESFENISRIADAIGVPESTLIDKLIIEPMQGPD